MTRPRTKAFRVQQDVESIKVYPLFYGQLFCWLVFQEEDDQHWKTNRQFKSFLIKEFYTIGKKSKS